MPTSIYKDPLTREEKEVIGAKDNSYEVDRIEGNLVYLKGAKYPHKGIPVPEAVHAVDILKTLTMGLLKFPLLFITPKKLLTFYNTIGLKIMSPYLLLDCEQMQVTRSLKVLIGLFLNLCGVSDRMKAVESAELIAHIFEYDSAYRFRLQDLATEAIEYELIVHPRKEIKRLLSLNMQRDYKEQSAKMARLGRLINLLLLIPKFRKAFVNTIKTCGIQGLKFDEGDRYWAATKTDYDYFGLPYDERKKLYV